MRIAQINCTYGAADSTGRNTMELQQFFLRNGYKSFTYAASINDNSLSENVSLFSSHWDMRIHGVLSRLTGQQGFFSKRATRKLLQILDKETPDVVFLGVLHSNCICMPLLFDYLARRKIPTILVLHDCWYYTGHCCHYISTGCERWKEHCGKCPQIHQWNKSWFFDHSDRILQKKHEWYNRLARFAVIGVSDWITNEARKSILKDADIIRRIYNWIDLDTFKPQNTDELRQKLGIAHDEKVLLGVASVWSKRKGLAEMQMVAQIPNVRVILVGEIAPNMILTKNIITVGRITNAVMLAQYYALADVFLNPSVQETFGKTTAEALSCGTPAVVYDTSACPELVPEGCGRVVRLGDADAYKKQIEYILCHPEQFERGREWAEDMFDMEKNMQQYVDIIDDLLKS